MSDVRNMRKKMVIDLKINTIKARLTSQSSVHARMLKKLNTVTDATPKNADRLCYRKGKPRKD